LLFVPPSAVTLTGKAKKARHLTRFFYALILGWVTLRPLITAARVASAPACGLVASLFTSVVFTDAQ
jgi:hypothetical protein